MSSAEYQTILSQLIPDEEKAKQRDDAMEEEDSAEENQEQLLLEQLVDLVERTGVTQLVETLGPQLTTENPVPRVKATAILCEVLRKLKDEAKYLDAEQAKTLLSFFLNRYETDWESALACARGILAILQRKSYSHETLYAQGFARMLLSNILLKHTVNELSQSLRFAVFEITRYMLTDHVDILQQQSREDDSWLARAFVDAMNGEKDPRCLLICLDIVAILLKNPVLGGDKFVEDAFDVTSVYFPITFRPPPNDPFGITHEDLVNSLNKAFCAIPSMAACVLPMAFEKIKMTSLEAAPARVEALRLISRCAREFDAVTFAPHLEDLRDSLVGLILSPEEAELAVEALEALKAVIRVLAPRAQVNPQDNLWDVFTLVTLRRCGIALQASFDSMAASGAARILVAVSESCAVGFATTLKGLVPLLEAYFTRIDQITTSRTTAVIDLIRGVARCVDPQIGRLPGTGPMDPFAETLFAIVIKQLNEVTFNNSQWVASQEESRLVYNCCLALKDIVVRSPYDVVPIERVVREAVPVILDRVLLQTIRSNSRGSRKDLIAGALMCLMELDKKCHQKDNGVAKSIIVPVLLEEAKSVYESPEFDFVMGDPKEKMELLLGLFPVLARAKDPTVAAPIVSFVASLDAIPSATVMNVLGRIAKAIDDPKVMEECFLSSNGLINRWMNTANPKQLLFILCERSTPEMNQTLAKRALEQILRQQFVDKGAEACLLAMRRDFDFVLPAIFDLLEGKSELVDDDAFLRIYASALNKCSTTLLSSDESQRILAVVDGISPKQAARIMGRAFKALTLRSASQLADRLGTFLQSLLHSEDEEVAFEASNAFGNLILTDGVDDGLNAPFVRALGVARQRAFEKWFKILSDDLEASKQSTDAILAAIVALSAGAPQGVLLENLRLVVPIMIRASKSEQIISRVSALRIMKKIAQESVESVESHLNTLVPFLVKFTTGPTRAPEPRDRLDALEVLDSLPGLLPYHKLHPYRTAVSSALAKGALDDPKRVVRQKAVECRERWVLFSA